MKMRSALLLALMMLCPASVSHALDYPKSYVRIIVPYPTGGSAESQARTLAEQLSKIWKQQVIVENKPGAGTTIGATFVAGSAPDGYTLYLAGTSHTVSPGAPLGFFASGIYSGIGAFFNELYPTSLRGSGIGFCFNVGRAIGALFPALVGYISATMPLGEAIGIFTVAAYGLIIMAALLLPETKGRSLAA